MAVEPLEENWHMKVHVNPFVERTVRVFPSQQRYGRLRYDMNENPEGLPAGFVQDVLKEITPEFLSIYPEPDKFLRKYSDYIGVGFENVLCTNGSDMAIRYLFETFGEIGKEVVTVTPSFEMYRVNCDILGYKHVAVSYESDLTLKIEKVIGAINENTRIVVLLNPNNPVGNVYSLDEFLAVQRRAEQVGALVIVDEAYHYFYGKTFLPYALSLPNVVVLRTFSKLMSLAAARLGVIVACPNLIESIRKLRLTFDVNSIALLFAERLLEHPEVIGELVKTQQEGKGWLLSQLRERGYWCRDCTGNYIFVRPHRNAREVAALLERRNVLVHVYGNPLLSEFVRVSTGSVRSMQKFIDEFLRADN